MVGQSVGLVFSSHMVQHGQKFIERAGPTVEEGDGDCVLLLGEEGNEVQRVSLAVIVCDGGLEVGEGVDECFLNTPVLPVRFSFQCSHCLGDRELNSDVTYQSNLSNHPCFEFTIYSLGTPNLQSFASRFSYVSLAIGESLTRSIISLSFCSSMSTLKGSGCRVALLGMSRNFLAIVGEKKCVLGMGSWSTIVK